MKLLASSLFLMLVACTGLDTGDDNLASRGGAGACDRTGSGLACSVDDDCAADEECEHGACKLHESACDGTSDDGPGDDHGGGGTDDGPGDDHGGGGTDDGPGDDHGGGGTDDGPGDDHGGGGTDDGPGAGECTVDADCGTGLECEDGACVPHGA